jgi:hypothetical protein
MHVWAGSLVRYVNMHLNLLALAGTPGCFNRLAFHRSAETAIRCSDSQCAGRSGDQIPVETRFSAPVQTGPGAHPAPYTMDTGSYPGVKRPRRGVSYLTTSSAEVIHKVQLYVYPPSRPTWSILRRNFPFSLTEIDSDSTMKVTIRIDTQTALNI